mgnify:CR=1 FL=1
MKRGRMPTAGRLIVVSNRLPFTAREREGGLEFTPSVGGLATGLASYRESLQERPQGPRRFLWVGWPGSTVSEERQREVRARSLDEFSAVPVFLSEAEIDKFYQGFCNKTIWPLFHCFQVYTNYDEEHWERYVEVNRTFCRTLAGLLRPGDTLWIHDYHLMLLPGMVREIAPAATIGFFLHIPFPNYELFRLLPSRWRHDILKGLLGADLVGFHTNDYRQDFLKCVLRILGHDSQIGELLVGDRVVRAEAFPMGIDYAKYRDGAGAPEVRAESLDLRRRMDGARIILSIDRLDYTKGIVNRLEGFETFLDHHPDRRGGVVLVMVVVPSRVAVEHYEMMKGQIEALVGRINGRFGRPGWTPVVYMYRSLPFAPLAALYAASDIALVTPLRDGMNLVAKEYIACRTDRTGVLILSEMAGAAQELLEAVTINPNSRHEIAEAIDGALRMPEPEQVRRNTAMQGRIERYDVVRWVADFMEELSGVKGKSRMYLARRLTGPVRATVAEAWRAGRRRLLLLDYDGTLVPFAADPGAAVPAPPLLALIGDLCGQPGTDVVIVSGRDKAFLEHWFADTVTGLVAEHGAWIREKGRTWRKTAKRTGAWKSKLKPMFERYAERVPGAFVEEKDFALVWHYRAAERGPAKLAAQELKDQLLALTANIDVHVLQGNKTVEARVAGVNKGTAGLHFLARKSYDFVLSIGDDATDEDLFAVLPETAWSIRVGMGATLARYNIAGVEEVLRLLAELATPKNAP